MADLLTKAMRPTPYMVDVLARQRVSLVESEEAKNVQDGRQPDGTAALTSDVVRTGELRAAGIAGRRDAALATREAGANRRGQ